MPFERPTLTALIDQVRGDIRGRLEIVGALLRRAMADALGAVVANVGHRLRGYLDWLADQLFVDTAEREALIRRAKPYGITPVEASFATGNVTITGTDGFSVLAGTVLKLDAATVYTVKTGATISGGTGMIVVTAVLAGAASNLAAGTTLTFESTVPGVNSSATVAVGGIADGVDEESTEQFRARFRLRLQEPPQGGADQDYEQWVLAAVGAGATRVWVFPNELGRGTVVVRFVNDNASPIFPDAGAVAAAQAAVDDQRPITAEATVVAPTELAVAFTIHLTPDTGDTRAAVTAELTDLFAEVGEPGDGAGRGKVLLSRIRTAIGVAAGKTDYTLTSPSADVVPGKGQLPTVGTITWT